MSGVGGGEDAVPVAGFFEKFPTRKPGEELGGVSLEEIGVNVGNYFGNNFSHHKAKELLRGANRFAFFFAGGRAGGAQAARQPFVEVSRRPSGSVGR